MSLKRDEDEYHGNGLHRPMEAHSSLSTIGHINYIRMFVSDRLQFPDEADEHLFGYKDLQEVQTIGQGSFAHVREMIHISTGRRMAVKRVRILGTGHDDTSENRSMKQLHKEVEAIRSASNCPQIVRFYGLTFHEGDGLVCMELMDISLHQLYKISHELAKEPFCETTLGAVAVATIRALQHLKVKHQIIHRDVKPSNILLSLNGLVKLCDFGICGYLEDSVNKTRDVGCRPYMAPERLSFTNRSYDSRSDVWSLGITLVEVANGEFPYKSFNTSPIFAQIQMVVYEDPPTIEPDHFSIKARNFVAAW
ncbi:hypothetical protein WR25_09187 isoform B [Diploscapter pachys]|uniref:mitogen-activated protein kinase kinase n=1 Tax=Diploscapter pachys TaxID=2018661 RepID=A0A2A2LY87_9BILA|nr:hypothetical protein WR25_09187 isoform B [Diploscapter pachys]